MNFKEFLAEAELDPSFDPDKFQEECKYYFDVMRGGANYLMMHGTKNKVIPGQKLAFRERNLPTDSPIMLHDAANKFFEEKFNHPFRNGLFVCDSTGTALGYGGQGKHVAIIIPVGKFEWLSSPDISDLYGTFQRYAGVPPYEIDVKRASTEKTMREVEKAKWYHNTDLQKCLEHSKNEIMLWCPNGFYTFTQTVMPKVTHL